MGSFVHLRMALRFSMKAKASKLAAASAFAEGSPAADTSAAAKLCPWPTQKCPDESWTIGELKSFVEGNGGDTSGVLEKQELYKLATEIGDRVLNDPLEAYMCGLREKAPTPAAAGEGSVLTSTRTKMISRAQYSTLRIPTRQSRRQSTRKRRWRGPEKLRSASKLPGMQLEGKQLTNPLKGWRNAEGRREGKLDNYVIGYTVATGVWLGINEVCRVGRHANDTRSNRRPGCVNGSSDVMAAE